MPACFASRDDFQTRRRKTHGRASTYEQESRKVLLPFVRSCLCFDVSFRFYVNNSAIGFAFSSFTTRNGRPSL